MSSPGIYTMFCSGDVDWWVGFSAKVLTPRRVTDKLPTFLEYAFLRKTDLGIVDAVQRTFNAKELLTHTGVLICHRVSGSTSLQEFTFTNQDSPWGIMPPDCPCCKRNNWVKAVNMASEGSKYRFRCSKCRTQSRIIARPSFIIPCVTRYLQTGRYFTTEFPIPRSTWAKVEWKKEGVA